MINLWFIIHYQFVISRYTRSFTNQYRRHWVISPIIGWWNYGVLLSYKIQKNPNGLAEAFVLGEEFIGSDSICLILGDNIFYGDTLHEKLINCIKIPK